ncbi:MAG TPA: helix-turn-helix domain-containing protein [Povalibacter sp.]|uniref:helix-turn-helix domain-containing protein n=1 Tax=Povalibacter sp. TaxID=1962978 RepID=UPI002CEE9ECD|nr:helix-turn-helix domain-containing protein [Povalibacter sp.]HMN43346.1 helix-turn-helix domain-containing protein [Povalibacter sp.]
MSKRSLPNASHIARLRSQRSGRDPFSRSAVVSRVVALIEGRPAASFHLSDLCSAAGVSERTLRTIFREQFGTSPKKFLRAHKLHNIRTALRASDDEGDTVSRIAARFGLSDAGRMAKDYYRLFGEYPGTTRMHRCRTVRDR